MHGPGRFLGELSVLTAQPELCTAVVLVDGAVLEVSAERMRALVVQEPVLGDEILRAYLIRRTLAIGLGLGFRIIGSRYSTDTRRLRDFAMRNRFPHRFIDLEDDPAADSLLRRSGVGPDDTPVVVWRDRLLRNPSIAQVAELVDAKELFVFIGATPCTDWLAGTLALDSGGYVLIGADAARVADGRFDELGRAPLMLETTEPGVFAVGDVRSCSIKRRFSRGGGGHGRPAGPRAPFILRTVMP
ncbi:MAG TPA: hypothetical protein VGJ13_17895 [Pseudonocardiaceae bacterium]